MIQAGDQRAEAHYEQQWQDQLALETKERLALTQRQQQEKGIAYLDQINATEGGRLLARHEAEAKALQQRHRAMRIALRKQQP